MQTFEQFHAGGFRARIRRHAGPKWQVKMTEKGHLTFFTASTRDTAEAMIQETLGNWGHVCDEHCGPWSAGDGS